MSRLQATATQGFALIARLGFYALTIGLVLELVVASARTGGVEAWMREDGIVETIQVCLAFATGLVFVVAATRRKPFHAWLAIAGIACMFAGARELDGLLGTMVGPRGYQLLAIPLGLAAAGVAFLGRERLPSEIREFAGCPASWFMFFGAFLVLVHAQILGQKELWATLLSEEGARTVKKSYEECSELTGYCLLACAAVEALIAGLRGSQTEARPGAD